ncbi:hypothetical protein TNCV_2765161 [Trichonephila clavipes]|nr:hypothetical protein TNCV_2765161 [Trichonephila clavipes]
MNDPLFNHWVKRPPPVLSKDVPIPERSDRDIYRNTTVIPYLKVLHCGGDEQDTEDDEDIFYRVIPCVPENTSANNTPIESETCVVEEKERKLGCINLKSSSVCKQS